MKRLFFIFLVLFSCSGNNPILPEDPSVLEIDTQLPQDSNGNYHLILNRLDNQTLQTLHRLSAFTGHLGQKYSMPKVGWEAYDENYNVKIWVYTEFGREYRVPIINGSSYPNMDGVVSTMFAPVISMVGDTVTVVCEYVSAYENELYDEVYIILD